MKKQQDVLNKKIMIIITAAVTAAVLLFGVIIYLCDYYPAVESEVSSIGFNSVSAIDYGDGIIAYEPTEIKAGIIFYPEAKVEYTAYENLLTSIAGRGYLCLLVEMPMNQPAWGVNNAVALDKRYPDVNVWYMAGHGSGAKAAASYASHNTDIFSGVIFLGGYPSTDLKGSGLKAVSIYGSEDKVMNIAAYEKSRSKMPEDFSEFVIDGGCHSHFGSYGIHRGDGTEIISMAEQLEQTADFIETSLG